MDYSNLQIETERLLLVPVSTKYTEQVYAEYREPMTKYMHHPSAGTLEELTERTKKWEKQLKDGERLFMAVLLKSTEEFLGCFALEGLARKDPEMGGWLKKAAHGNKYGQEAAEALKKWADENLDYNYITWPCAKENIGSCKVAESLGGNAEKEYSKTNSAGYTWDFIEYRFLRKRIIFITGASGVGKTTLANQLEQKYVDTPSVAVLKFDSIGVPSIDEMNQKFGSPSGWQKAMTNEWVRRMVQEMNESLIILDGQVNLDFIDEACKEHNFINYKTVLIDCDVDVMCKRLSEERGQPELANDDMRNWLKFLRNQAAEKQAAIIDTTNLSKEEVLKEFNKHAQ